MYSYYELAIQKWCSDDYNIHGLWPQYNSSSYPSYCSQIEYVYPKAVLLSLMKQYWDGCNDNLWKHEWVKHGSCVYEQNHISEYKYFNKTIELFIKYKDKIKECGKSCILGCFDLNYNFIKCPKNL